MSAQLPGVEDVDFVSGTVPAVVVAHCACYETAADVVHGLNSEFDMVWIHSCLGIFLAEREGEAVIDAQVLGIEELVGVDGAEAVVQN